LAKRLLGAIYSRGIVTIALLTMLVSLAVFFWPAPTLMDRFEWRTVDWRFHRRHQRAPLTPHPDIVIVEVDEESIRKKGIWPWGRGEFAELTQRLDEAGARAIIFDIFFVDPAREDAEGDAALVRATAVAGNVYHAGFALRGDEPAEEVSSIPVDPVWAEAQVLPGRGLDAIASLHRFVALAGPASELATAARGVGFIDVMDTGDGVYRLALPVGMCEGKLYPSLAVVVAADLAAVSPDRVKVVLGQGTWIGDAYAIPIDRGGYAAINFVGPDHTFPYVPAWKVTAQAGELTEEEKLPADTFRDKLVLISMTAAGQYDLRATPYGSFFHGVEIQANILDNILLGRFLQQLEPERTGLIIIFVSLAMGLGFSLLRPVQASAFGLLLLWAHNALAGWAFNDHNLIVPMVPPSLAIVLALISLLTYRVLVEERQSYRVHEVFAHFAPPPVVRELERAGTEGIISGERRDITVLFSDLRHFTRATGNMQPEDVVSLLNRYFSLMHEVIWEFGGTLDKFIGDELMALFNVPLAQPDHTLLAVRCAVEMQRRIHSLSGEWAFYGMPELAAGMGIASGEAVVGCMGSPGRVQYTAVGVTVNLAARLEELSKQLKAQIVISQSVWEQVKEEVRTEPLAPAMLQGFDEPVQAYKVIIE